MLLIEKLIFKTGKGLQFIASGLTLLASALFISFALVIKFSIDVSTTSTFSSFDIVWMFCLFFLSVRLLMPVCYALLEFVIHTYCMRAESFIRKDIFNRFTCIYAEHLESANRNEIFALFETAMGSVNSYIRTLWSDTLPVVLQTAFIIGSVWYYTGTLIAVEFISVIAIYIYIIITLTSQRFPLMRQVAVSGKKLSAILYSLGSVFLQIKLYQAEQRSSLRYNESVDALIEKQQAVRNVFFRFGLITTILSVIGSAIVISTAGYRYLENQISFGSLIMVATFLFQVFLPLNRLGVLWRALNRARIDFRLLEEALTPLAYYTCSQSLSSAADRDISSGMVVQLQGISKTKSGSRIFQGLTGTLQLASGGPVFLCGQNGTGKTSLLRLLCHVDKPDEGDIAMPFKGQKHHEYGNTPPWMAVAPQSTSMMAGSIASNLQFFLGDYDETDYQRLATILDFPFAPDNTVEEGGRNFSGGQLQKLNLIIALLRDAQLLILDEPTAGLDSASVASLAELLRLESQYRYMLIVTHDESLKRYFPEARSYRIMDGSLVTAPLTDSEAG